MNIGVVGGGVVGRATARVFIEHVDEVRVYDIVKERRTHNLDEVLCASDLVFVCLPTPQLDSSHCDLSYIRLFFDIACRNWRDHNYVLRSTVPIGTTRSLRLEYGLTNLVHNPEFLTARCAVTDAHIPSRIIVGGDHNDIMECENLLIGLYEKRFPGIDILCMTSDDSEAVKLFLNSFFAVKVAFFNEIHTLTTKLGLNWGDVLLGMLSDGRIAHSHTKVPGPDGLYGYGGTCLPKDSANLLNHFLQNGLECEVLAGAIRRNISDRKRGMK